MKIIFVLLILISGLSYGQILPAASPHVLVYKTRKNYNKNVPIILTEDKKHIISYPAPTDLKSDNKYPTPTRLKHGYLLDNRGIGPNVAFIKMTYAQYARLSQAPTPEALLSMVIDNAPLTELIDCGSRYSMKDPVIEINAKIEKGELRKDYKAIK